VAKAERQLQVQKIYKLYIGGKFARGENGRVLPASGEPARADCQLLPREAVVVLSYRKGFLGEVARAPYLRLGLLRFQAWIVSQGGTHSSKTLNHSGHSHLIPNPRAWIGDAGRKSFVVHLILHRFRGAV
jgi:hypothetical protein